MIGALKNISTDTINAYLYALLANRYSGEDHKDLWMASEDLLDEIIRLRKGKE